MPTNEIYMESKTNKLPSEVSLSVRHFNDTMNDHPNKIQQKPLVASKPPQKKPLQKKPKDKKPPQKKPITKPEKRQEKKRISEILEKPVLLKQPSKTSTEKKSDFLSKAPIKSVDNQNDLFTPSEDIAQSTNTNVSKASQVEESAIINTKGGIPIVKNPGYLSKSPPVYPRRALQRKQEGKVVIDALLNREGEVKKIEIFKSSGYKSLDQSALRAVKKWKFKPFENELEYFQVLVRIPITFELNKL